MSQFSDPPDIDIRRPPGTEVLLTCPACGLERRLHREWRDFTGTDEIMCAKDNVPMTETKA